MFAYTAIYITTLKEYVFYRLNFILWRFRMVLATLINVFIWLAVFENRQTFGHYSQERMISYILYTSVITTFVASSRTGLLASEIQSGDIMNKLLKPLSIFKIYATQDLTDKTTNTLFGILELLGIVVFFSLPLIPPKQPFIFFFFLCCSVCISFFINFMLSCVGFWTPEIWAPRFLFLTLIFFISGSYFPLDLLPEPLYRFLLFTPFPYLYYLPTKILVDGVQNKYILQQCIGAVVWVYGTYRFAQFIWNKGMREFSFWGK